MALTVITSDLFLPGRGHEEIARAGISGGATAVQVRANDLTDDRLVRLATRIARWCGEAGVVSIVNDRPDVAGSAGADGVHVGQTDDPAAARALLHPGAILGVSVGTVEQAVEAGRFGANYVAVTVWSTPTKPEAVAVGLDGLREIANASSLPVVGIGGIEAGNAGQVIEAGAIGVAVISAVAGAADPVGATQELRMAVGSALERRLRAAG
jgi:thiamine-phosphate pyrophosphorylase